MRRQLLALTILCILTITGFTALLAVPSNAATSDAKVVSYSWYTAPLGGNAANEGDLVVVGEIENNGTSNIGYMYVHGYAYINETLVAEASAQIYGNNIEPGQKAPFYLDFLPGYSSTGDNTYAPNVTSVIVVPSYVSTTDKSMYQGLTATSENSTSGGYTVLGSVKNTGSETIGDVRVITTFYNSSGTVVSVNYTDVLSDALSPGNSVSYSARPIDGYSGEITSYSILVQSTPNVATTTPTPTATPTPTPTATPTTSTSASATPTATPSGTQDYTMIIVGIVVVVAVVLVAAVLLMRRRGSSTPAPA